MADFSDPLVEEALDEFQKAKRQLDYAERELQGMYERLARLNASVGKHLASDGNGPFTQAHLDALENQYDTFKARIQGLLSNAPADLPADPDVDIFS